MHFNVLTKSLWCFVLILNLEINISLCQTTNLKPPKGFVDGKQCLRSCDGQKMKCFYHFQVENVYSMGKACFQCPEVPEDCFRTDCIIGGGLTRTLTVVNRQMPGPSIQVCEGDTVMVVVENKLGSGESTTIHWHGQHVKNYQYMDGVPFVTQCPIIYNDNFVYRFIAEQIGTHFWHSHLKLQRGEGMFGSFVVRQQKGDNTHAGLYDYDKSEHIMMMGDWNDKNRMDVNQDYRMGPINKVFVTGFLINGQGYQFHNNITDTPLANFVVEQGMRYRFRMISVGFMDCPFEITIDNHTMKVIATDGQDVEPTEVTSIIMSGGERFDVVVKADQPPSTYWIRIKGYVSCKDYKVIGLALLQYQNSPISVPNSPIPNYETATNGSGITLNPISKKNATNPVLTINQLKPVMKIPKEVLAKEVNKKFTLFFEMNQVDSPDLHRAPYYGITQVPENMQRATAQINHISYRNLNMPLMPARKYINDNEFCTDERMEKKNMDCAHNYNYCECPHVLEIGLGDVVELILIEPSTQNKLPVLHPIHLHGFYYYVLGWGEIGDNITREQVMEMDKNGILKRNLIDPPTKDTVALTKGGYVIVRFIANNPGFWLLHCHVEIHAEDGMELVLKVGGNFEIPNPPSGFPKCGNYPSDNKFSLSN